MAHFLKSFISLEIIVFYYSAEKQVYTTRYSIKYNSLHVVLIGLYAASTFGAKSFVTSI